MGPRYGLLVGLIPASITFSISGGMAMGKIRPTYLRCEYRVNPMGIDSTEPRLSWLLESIGQEERGQIQSAYRILVASSRENVEKDIGDLWDTGKVESNRTSQIAYSGKPLRSGMECWWKVMVWDKDGEPSDWSEPARWTMGLLDPSDWKAKWIGYDAPWEGFGTELPPLPFLRKEFSIGKGIKRAILYVSALGSCEVRLNGQRVGEDIFIPGWSYFRKRAYYRAYDVTDLLKVGRNAIGAILADEWYAGFCGGWGKRNAYGGEPRLLLQLSMDFQDGTEGVLVSDGTWKAKYGPILEADFYMGETYDARREMPGWDSPGFDDSDWEPVAVTDKVGIQLTSHPGEPVRKLMELRATSMHEPKPGVFVFDMGQNMVGWARIKVKGERGRRITLRFAEVLNPDGTIYRENLRRARCTDTYICKGEGEEIWEPGFTFRGFRYVEVTGYPGRPPLDAVTGVVVGSDVPIVGSFECSNPLVNRLLQNIIWSLRGNYLEVPTDCPQRDERQGWTGDAQIFARTASYLADISAFMTKWLIDLNDSQRDDGAYPDVAPFTGAGFGTPAWGDAGIIIPYILYLVYGDKRIIERYYERMARYIDYLIRNSRDLLRPDHGYGDWVPAGAETPKDVLATAYFAYVSKLMSEMAEAIGRKEDGDRYRDLFEKIKDAFNKAYVLPDGRIKGETQTCYVLALYLDLLPESLRPLALNHLVSDIERRDWHLSTGFVGTRMLLPVLSRFGRDDVAYRLFLQETYPSWLYPVKHGATTIWERWDSWREDRGFQDPGMNSFNHYAFGSVGEWIFSTVVGIDTDGPGFRRIRIHPHLDGLDFVRARYKSIAGEIGVEWRKRGDKLEVDLLIPVNAKATVYLPAKGPEYVLEGGVRADLKEGIAFLRMEEGRAVYEIGSGSYSFVVEGY
jgi:alpha-L-rhamnosidase